MNATELEAYVDEKNHANFYSLTYAGNIDQPFVTGHKYRFTWGDSQGTDFRKMYMTIDQPWTSTDKSIYLVHKYNAKRSSFIVSDKLNGGREGNNTIGEMDTWKAG